MSELQCLVFVSIISADNDEFTEEQKQEVMRRYELFKGKEDDADWTYILEPVDDTGRLAKLFKKDDSRDNSSD